MRFITPLLLAGLFTASLTAQSQPTTADWQADLRHLQKTIHDDYPFLFKKTTVAAFDAEVEKLNADIPKLARHEIIVGFARLVSSFEYGHTSISLRGDEVGFHQLPVTLYEFSDGVYVEGVHKDHAAALGARVVRVNGMPVADALAKIRPVVPAENDQFMKGYGLRYLTYPEVLHAQGVTKTLQQQVSLTLEKDGRTFDHTFPAGPMLGMNADYGFTHQDGDWLSARSQDKTPYYLKNLDKRYYFDYLPEDKAVYVRYSSVFPDPSENIQDFYDRVFASVEENDVDKLIIDVRLNGGGNNFNNKHVVKGLIQSEKIDQVGKLFVIIGRRTFSACQNLINELGTYTNVIFVGEPSAENVNFYGDNRTEVLPSSQLPVRLSWAWWQDKPQWQNADWTVPQLPTALSFADYRTNQDPALAAALNFDAENFILDPMQHLTDLFLARKIAELQSEATRMVKDPTYRYFDFEGEFNAAGLRLLGTGQVEPATMLLGMTAQLFPESAGAQVSLAEAYLKGGQPEKAKPLLQKATALDPAGEAGRQAKALLAEME